VARTRLKEDENGGHTLPLLHNRSRDRGVILFHTERERCTQKIQWRVRIERRGSGHRARRGFNPEGSPVTPHPPWRMWDGFYIIIKNSYHHYKTA
jgi:hypothetical protein